MLNIDLNAYAKKAGKLCLANRLKEIVRELDRDVPMTLDEFNKLGDEARQIMAELPGHIVDKIFRDRRAERARTETTSA